MNARGHQSFGRFTIAACGAILVPALGCNPQGVTIASVIAAKYFAHGRFSPDADQTWLKPFVKHRVTTHRLSVPVALTVLSVVCGAPFIVTSIPLAWVSHLWADMICGKAGYGRGKGIMIGGKWCGLGLKTGGRTERRLVHAWDALFIVVTACMYAGYVL